MANRCLDRGFTAIIPPGMAAPASHQKWVELTHQPSGKRRIARKVPPWGRRAAFTTSPPDIPAPATRAPEAFERLLTRCGLPIDQHSAYSYTSRDGDLILPYDEAVAIARKFCATEPSTVLVQA